MEIAKQPVSGFESSKVHPQNTDDSGEFVEDEHHAISHVPAMCLPQQHYDILKSHTLTVSNPISETASVQQAGLDHHINQDTQGEQFDGSVPRPK